MHRFRNVAALAAAIALAACGGSSSSSGTPSGTTPTAFSQGTVQRFGSVFVNGVEWRTAGATLKTPDDSASPSRRLGDEAEIRGHVMEGEAVRVKGVLDADRRHGQATEIEVHRTLEGVVSNRSPSGFDVSGVHVSVDAQTHHRNGAGADDGYAAIANGQRVAVTGAGDDRGGLRASSVRVVSSSATDAEVKGYALAPPAGGSFQLALTRGGAVAVVVNVSGVGSLPTIVGGSFVEVHGTPVAGASPPAILAATVTLEDDPRAEAGMEAEFEGIVTSGTAASFVVAGQQVTTSATTVWVGAADPANPTADLVVGTKVEVEGTVDSGGVLAAAKVKFQDGARIAAPISAVALSGSTPATATFTMLGKTVMTAPDVRLEGLARLSDLATGQFLEVRGSPLADGTILARRVTLASSGGGNRPYVAGVVTAKAAPSLTVLGIQVNTTGAEYRAEDESALTQTAFFDAITAGSTIVKVRWDVGTNDTSAAPKQAEIEVQDG